LIFIKLIFQGDIMLDVVRIFVLIWSVWPARNLLNLDDHIIARRRVCRKLADDGPKSLSRDERIIADSRTVYASANLDRVAREAFYKQCEFGVCGAEVNDRAGGVGPPPAMLHLIPSLCCSAPERGWLTKRGLQQVIGQCVRPFQHRRELISMFQSMRRNLQCA
jgi:hypothetical protein